MHERNLCIIFVETIKQKEIMTKKHLESAIKKINEMLIMAKTDSSIDVKDLKAERDNARRELNKIRRAASYTALTIKNK